MDELKFQPTPEYKAWYDANYSKLRDHSIYSKGAAIWSAAIASAQQSAPSAELPPPQSLIVESDIGHRAYSTDQMRAYGQACAKAAAATNPLVHNALLVAALREISSNECAVFDEDTDSMVMVSMDTEQMVKIAAAALASIPRAPEA